MSELRIVIVACGMVNVAMYCSDYDMEYDGLECNCRCHNHDKDS